MTGNLMKMVYIRTNSRETLTKQISDTRKHNKMFMDSKKSFASEHTPLMKGIASIYLLFQYLKCKANLVQVLRYLK